MSTPFYELERFRQGILERVVIRDDISPVQQSILLMLHNCDVIGGGHPNIAMIAPKPPLRVLLKRGLINGKCRLTRAGDDLVRKWSDEARGRKPR